MKARLLIAGLAGATLLAGCVVENNPAPSQPAPQGSPGAAMAPQGRDPGRVAGAGAAEDCRFAVATQLGIDMGQTWVVDSSMGETSTRVLVGASTAQAPWACYWGGPSAGVLRVEYTAEG